jgi:hypothetical protein
LYVVSFDRHVRIEIILLFEKLRSALASHAAKRASIQAFCCAVRIR